MSDAPLYKTDLKSLPFLHRGKVRDIYADGDDKLLVVQSDRLSAFDVILDDRDERPGAMFADWELIGVPVRLTIGDRGLKEGQVELTVRRGLVTRPVALAQAFDDVLQTLQSC